MARIPLRRRERSPRGASSPLSSWRYVSRTDDWKALHYAVQYRAYRTLSVLVERGVDIELHDDEARTPLMRAARAGIARMITFLIDSGADLHAKDSDGRSPYDHAIDAGKRKAAILLRI